MKRFRIQEACVALVCLVAILGFTGCGGGSDSGGPPSDINGTWGATFTKAGEDQMNETWTIVQTGQTVNGSYTFGANTWSYNGSYIDGVLDAIDGDNWTLHIVFSGNTGTGTIAGDGQVWNAILTR